MDEGRSAFLRKHTTVGTAPLVPEIALHIADGIESLWQLAQDRYSPGLSHDDGGVGPPFWAFPWAGGQVISRYVLDNPGEVRGRSVIDVATGSGLCALAAARAGADRVAAVDIDPFCAIAVAANSALNVPGERSPFAGNGSITVRIADAFTGPPPDADVVLAGDVWYDRALAAIALPWLRAAHENGSRVLIGDPGRDFLPPAGWTVLARYLVPTPRALEGRDAVPATVATLAG
jgi:predicted nicotinamide N-methyase